MSIAESHNPLVPHVYDVVWTIAAVGVLALLVAVVVVVVVLAARGRRGGISDGERQAVRSGPVRR